MATIVKGDFVQVNLSRDWSYSEWTVDHNDFCDKVCKVVNTDYEKWTDQFFLELEYRGKRLWFRADHVIKVDNYEVVFSESLHEAIHQLNETERICKKLRDEILSEAFGEGPPQKPEEFEDEDSIFDDWEEVTTKEVIPLPGNGGTMTTTTTAKDPKATADANRKKIRKIKNIGKKISKKKKASTSGSLASSWTLTEEEMEELQDYIDSLPYSNGAGGDIDYYYGYDEFDEWEPDGNGD